MNLPILIGCFVVLVFLRAVAHGHTTEELKQEFGEVPEPLVNITEIYERALRQPNQISPDLEPYQRDAAITEMKLLRSQLHSRQHDMLSDYRNNLNCLELLEKIPAAERRLHKLEKAGRDTESDMQAIDKMKAWTSIHCAPGAPGSK